MKILILTLTAVWFALVFVLGTLGAFLRPPGVPPFPILIGAAGPLIVFAALYSGSAAFRESLRTADLRLLTAIQAWRFAGIGFLALCVHGILPGLFAWPAGLGDMAIGLTAPWIMLALIRRPSFVSSRWFIAWNLFGMLDLIVALTTGALNSGFIPALAQKVTTSPMAQMPLVLIPAFFVPLLLMLHMAALMQAGRAVGRAG